MGDVADAAAALAAVTALRQQITDAYQVGGPLDAPSCARLAGQVARIAEDAHWMRDAVLVLARRSGVSWAQLEQATGTPDATLANRRRKFLDRSEPDVRRR